MHVLGLAGQTGAENLCDCFSLRRNFFDIPTPIEYTNDFRPIIIQTIEYHMKAGGERAQTRSISSRDRPA
jgi:hypothetical protein